jgi:betaine lipid synthase
MLVLSSFLPRDPFTLVVVAVGILGVFLLTVFVLGSHSKGENNTLHAYLKFFWACFVKPHTGDGSGSQQDALVNGLSV